MLAAQSATQQYCHRHTPYATTGCAREPPHLNNMHSNEPHSPTRIAYSLTATHTRTRVAHAPKQLLHETRATTNRRLLVVYHFALRQNYTDRRQDHVTRSGEHQITLTFRGMNHCTDYSAKPTTRPMSTPPTCKTCDTSERLVMPTQTYKCTVNLEHHATTGTLNPAHTAHRQWRITP